MRPERAVLVAAAVTQTLFAWSVLSGLGAPLLWQDEGETAMFGRRVLERGFPAVHGAGPRGNTVYGVAHLPELGIHAPMDAYLGSPWGQYYFAAPAVAWSDRASDLAERTRRLRLPFALAGLAGVWLLLAAGAAWLPRETRVRGAYWALCGGLLCASVSLQLHLREARYYGPVVLGVGALAWVLVRRHRLGELAPLPAALALAPWIWWLSTLFYPAFLAVMGTAGALLAWRPRSWLREGAPFLLAGVAALPLLLLFDVPAQGRAFLERFGGADGIYAARLADAGGYLLRYEFAVPALLGAAALWARDPRAPESRACAVAWLGVAVWTLLVARTPFFYERYLVALSPLLVGVCGVSALALAGRRDRTGLAALGLALAVSLGLRGPEVAGRLAELTGEPYRGPLDHVIPYLAERYPEPGKLVIATNYEGPSYMFYLGATTTLGFYAPDRARDEALAPDVIIPRPWGVNLGALLRLSRRGDFEAVELPVVNTKANNVPMLSRRNQAGLVHRFAPPEPGPDAARLLVLLRRAPPTEGADPGRGPLR